jgi:CHAD domain-containing protein
MARPRPIPGLDCRASYADGAAKVVAVRAEELFAHRDRVLDTTDIEPLHAMRVASRRLRAALEIFKPCFPRRAFDSVLDDVKTLADALGERRDRDVQIEKLERHAEERADGERGAVTSFVARLRAEQIVANRALERTLGDIERADLQGRLRLLVERAR